MTNKKCPLYDEGKTKYEYPEDSEYCSSQKCEEVPECVVFQTLWALDARDIIKDLIAKRGIEGAAKVIDDIIQKKEAKKGGGIMYF